MAFNNSDYAIVLPNQFATPSEVLQSAANRKERQQERLSAQQERDRNFNERQREFQERQRDKDQADEYRKVQMINEYANLDKHQTGNDVADAVGGNIINMLKPKFVEMARNGTSYADLYGAINSGMSNVSEAMKGIKTELNQADAATKMLKDKFGNSLDSDALLKTARADVINRRLDAEHNFVNPLSVQPSEFTSKLSDPRYLSQFVKSSANLDNEIINPKGLDQLSVPTGSADAHNIYDARIPYWKQPNFTPEQVKKGGGFLPQGFVPQLITKSETIPLDKLPKKINENKPFTIADKGVYDRFTENPNTNLELIAKTRKAYPDYDKFTDLEKEYAERHVLHSTIESLDRSNFQYKSTVKPARTSIINNFGGDVPTIKRFAKIQEIAKTHGGKVQLNLLPPETSNFILDKAKNMNGGMDVPQEELIIKTNEDGNLYAAKTSDRGKTVSEWLFPIDEQSIDIQSNKPLGQKSIKKVVAESQQPSTKNSGGMVTVVLDGKEGQIPSDKIDAFMKKYPTAKRK